MAKYVFNCPYCKSGIESDDSYAGGTADCPVCGKSILVPMPGIQPDRVIGNFKIISKLGSGGMGEVWLAEQLAMERKVALKILSPALVNNPDFVDRFMAEVKMTAKLHHHNMITAFDAGNDQGVYYLAMSYVDGAELSDRIAKEGKIPEKEALHIIRDVAEALNYAWSKFKILHRDIKPANIMIDSDGTPKLMDMGISKCLSEEKELTMTGAIVGTPYYMSPEQARAEELDCRSDIYSLGATFYHLVTGEVPFDANTAMGIITRHITDPLPPPEIKNPELSPQCSALLHIMMAKKREERQEDWERVVDDIKLVLHGKMPGTPLPPSAPVTTASQAIQQIRYVPGEKVLTPLSVDSLPSSIFSPQMTDAVPRPGLISFKTFAVVVALLSVISVTAVVSFILAKNQSDESTNDVPERLEIMKPAPVYKDSKTAASDATSSVDRLRQDSESQVNVLVSDKESEQPVFSEDPAEKERKCRELWELASSFADKNPLQAELACANFEDIRKKFPDLKYAAMASDKIKEIKNRALELKAQKIEKLMASLDKTAEPFVKSEDFQKAIAVYLEYQGPLIEESRGLRQNAAKKLQESADLIKALKERKQAEAESRRTEFYKIYLENMLKPDYSAASDLCSRSADIPLAAEMKKYSDELADADVLILKTLESDIGKYIEVETRDGRKKVRIKKLKGPAIYYEMRLGKGLAVEKTSVKNLSFNEKSKRLSEKVSSEAMSFYIMAYVAKTANPDQILKYMDKLPGPLANAVTSKLDTEKSEKFEDQAQSEFLKMLKIAGFKSDKVSLDEIKSFVADLPYSNTKQEDHKKLLANFKAKFGDTAFAGNSKELMDAFLIPEPEIQKAIKGKILSFNKSTCEICIVYEFNNSDELYDWENMSPRKRMSKAFIADGSLVIGGGAPTILVNRVPFKNLMVSFEGKSEGDFNELLFNPNNCMGFVIGGMGGNVDGYVIGRPPFRGPECHFFRVGQSAMIPGEKINGALSWNSNSVSFAYGNKKWKEISYKQDEVRFGLMGFRTENKYGAIILKGTVEKNWCDNPPEFRQETSDNAPEDDPEDKDMNWGNEN